MFNNIKEKTRTKIYNNLKYSDKTTKKYLDKVLPVIMKEYNINPNLILFSDSLDLMDFDSINFHSTLTSSWMYKKFKRTTMYFRRFNSKVREYILNTYQIDGYVKMTINDSSEWDETKDRFGWNKTPYNKKYDKGVVFFKQQEEK